MEGIDIYDVNQNRVYGRCYNEVFSFQISVDDFAKICSKDKKYFAERIHNAYGAYTEAKMDAVDVLEEGIDAISEAMLNVDLAAAVRKIKLARRAWIKYSMLFAATDWFMKHRPPIYKETWLD